MKYAEGYMGYMKAEDLIKPTRVAINVAQNVHRSTPIERSVSRRTEQEMVFSVVGKLPKRLVLNARYLFIRAEELLRVTEKNLNKPKINNG